MSTVVNYVCDPDRTEQVWESAKTVLKLSASVIDEIIVFIVSDAPLTFSFPDQRVVAKWVPPRFGDYFYGNKTYLCDLDAERVVFLDADTFVLESIDSLWSDSNADFLARPGRAYYQPEWQERIWSATRKKLGSKNVPMYNAGALVFQNRSHQVIRNSWVGIIEKYLDKTFALPYPDKRMPEQFSLSLAISRKKYGLTIAELKEHQHRYGWENPEPIGSTVFHTSALYENFLPQLGVSDSAIDTDTI